jgi:hypothetical protein
MISPILAPLYINIAIPSSSCTQSTPHQLSVTKSYTFVLHLAQTSHQRSPGTPGDPRLGGLGDADLLGAGEDTGEGRQARGAVVEREGGRREVECTNLAGTKLTGNRDLIEEKSRHFNFAPSLT